MQIDQQQHGYVRGHRLLGSSIKLGERDQDVVDSLSDLSSSLAPGEICPPYLTGYPLPSGSHYVLARTWYDESSSRSGCVLTHSLFIQMEAWTSHPSPGNLVRLLTLFEKQKRRTLPTVPETRDELAPAPGPVPCSRCISLTEALFLDERAPVVWFNVDLAEAAAMRVVHVLWPTARREFSFCTFALRPRSIGGRNFDLIVAPPYSRSRFANWSGYQVESSRSPIAQNRWTERLARSVFEDETPSLSVEDDLGILSSSKEPRSFEQLRLALLWSELKDKAEYSPNAALGLIDILAVADIDPNLSRQRANSVLGTVVPNIPKSLPQLDALHLLEILAQKVQFSFRSDNGFEESGNTFRRSAQRIAGLNPQVASAEIPITGYHQMHLLGRSLRLGIVDTLAEAKSNNALISYIKPSTDDDLADLLSSSTTVSENVMSMNDEEDGDLLIRTAEICSKSRGKMREKLRERLLPLIVGTEHLPVFGAIVTRKDRLSPTEIIRPLLSSPLLRGGTLDDILASAFLPERSRELRDTLLSTHVCPDSLLLKTLQYPSDVIELLSDDRLDRHRRTALVSSWVSSIDVVELERMAHHDPRVGRLVLDAMSAEMDDKTIAVQTARILPHLGLSPSSLVEQTMLVAEHLDTKTLEGVLRELLPEILDAVATNNVDLVTLEGLLAKKEFNAAVHSLSSRKILDAILPPRQQKRRRAAQGLRLAARLTGQLRRAVLRRFEEFSSRMVSARPNLSAQDFEIWASLADEFIEDPSWDPTSGAAICLTYAFERTDLQSSALVRSTFPRVYRAVSSPRYVFGIPTIFDLLGRDRSDDLRVQLIGAFLESDWPPGDLLKTALAAGAGSKILDRLRGTSKGRRYIRAMEKDLSSNKSSETRAAHRYLEKFSKKHSR